MRPPAGQAYIAVLPFVRGRRALHPRSFGDAEHELWKKNIARFVELYAFLIGIDLHGYGSTTFKKEAKERGAEPDECYLIGKKPDAFQEIVVEVIHSAPLLNKQEVYAGMEVSEVWVFKDGAFGLFALDRATKRYVEVSRSALLPSLDFSMVARYVVREDTPQALREFAAAIRS